LLLGKKTLLDSPLTGGSTVRTSHILEVYIKTPGPILGIMTAAVVPAMLTAYGELARKLGRVIADGAFSLHYDAEFKEDDADIEVVLPVRRPVRAEKIECRTLKGGRAVTAIHRGPYSEIGRSYKRVFGYLGERGLTPLTRSREVYLKGPDMFFADNPKKYLTELQILVT
jgi:effector-binding domain-containing protein